MNLAVILSIGESFNGLRGAGQESRFIKEYLERYAKRFDKVYVLSYAHETRALPEGVILVKNRFRLHRFVYTLFMPFIERKIFRSCQVVRVMQTPGAIPALFAHWFFGIPYVVTYGYEYVHLAAFGRKYIRATILRYIIPRLLKQASAVIITSPIREAELRQSGVENIIFIPNSVDTEVFRPREQAHKKSYFSILYVGRLEKEKNLSLLIESISRSPYRERYELQFIGTGTQEYVLKELAQRLRVRYRFFGVVPHSLLDSYYREADTFALLSVSEGHPKALLEALASGLPCIVTKPVGSVVGLKDQEQACFVQQNFEDIQKQLDRLLNDPELCLALGNAARVFCVKYFDIERILTREVNLLFNYAQAAISRS